MFLHPKGHVIGADDVGLVICWDLGTAYAISQFGDHDSTETKSKLSKLRRRKKSKLLQSTQELQKYRTGPVVDEEAEAEEQGSMSYTATDYNTESIEQRLRLEISNRGLPERSSRHGSSKHDHDQGPDSSTHGSSAHGSNKHDLSTDDTLESGASFDVYICYQF